MVHCYIPGFEPLIYSYIVLAYRFKNSICTSNITLNEKYFTYLQRLIDEGAKSKGISVLGQREMALFAQWDLAVSNEESGVVTGNNND